MNEVCLNTCDGIQDELKRIKKKSICEYGTSQMEKVTTIGQNKRAPGLPGTIKPSPMTLINVTQHTGK